MIIPIRCFTCGKVIADKWRSYERQCAEMDLKRNVGEGDGDGEADQGLLKATPRDKILNDLGLTRMCCRRHMLTHVDLHNHA